MTTSYSERDKPSREMNSAAAQPGGMAGSTTVDSEQLVDRNRRFQRAPSPNLSGPPGTGYGDNRRWDHTAGEANGRAFLNSHAVGDDTETYDGHAMSSTDNNAFKQHMRQVGNATAPKGDSTARLCDRGALKDGFNKPDGTNFENWRPQGDIPRVVTSLQKGGTPRWHGTAPQAEEYNVRKAQVHASLWQQEIRKQVGEATSVDGNADSVSIASKSFPRNGNEGSNWDTNKNMPEDWETFIQPEEFNEDTAVKEEAMMLEEFERRKEQNRIQIASFVKQHLYARRRPVDGWKYIVNNFGSESKGAKGSALKLDGRQVRANDMEKLTLRREGVRSGRKTE